MSARFWIGETVRVTFTFTDPTTGLPVAPGGVVVRARKPDATTGTYSASVLANIATADIAADQAGDWWVRATATTPSASAVEITFSVLATRVP